MKKFESLLDVHLRGNLAESVPSKYYYFNHPFYRNFYRGELAIEGPVKQLYRIHAEMLTERRRL